MHHSTSWPVALVAVITLIGSIPLAGGLGIQGNDAVELQAGPSTLAGQPPAPLVSTDWTDREQASEVPRLAGQDLQAGNLDPARRFAALAGPDAGAASDAPGVPGTGAVEACEQREDHPLIRITEEHGPQGFTWTNPETGEDEHRPGSGVVAGDGSADDPFVIAGWCIKPLLGVLGAGIHIQGTSSHVRVLDNAVVGSGPIFDEAAVRIEDAANVGIENNTLGWAEYGIGTWGSDGIEIRNNTLEENNLYGVWAAQLENATIEANLVQGNRNGLGIGLAHGSVVQGNTVEQNENTGIMNAFSDAASIVANQVSENREGLFVREAFDVRASGNVVTDHSGGGIAFDLSPRGTVEDSLIAGSGSEGLIFWASSNGTAVGNTVTSNGHADDRSGIRMAYSADGVVTNNTLSDNANGIVLDDSPRGWIADNLVETSSGDGMLLWTAEDATAARNLLDGNGIGVRVVEGASGVRLVANNIQPSEHGVGLNATEANDEVDARDNWWGCPDGPDAAACEDVEGDARYEPWLTAPNPEAGKG